MTDFDDLDTALIGLRRLWAHSGTFFDRELGQVDLSSVLVCREIANGEAVSVADIAAGLDVAHSTASRLVDRAEQTGAVRRVPSAEDARRTTLHLTASGRRFNKRATQFRLHYLQDLLDDWSPPDVARLAHALTRFGDAVRTNPPGGTT